MGDRENSQTRWENITAEQLGQVFGENTTGVYRGMGFKHARPRPIVNGVQVRAWVIPSLREARAIWDEKRFKVAWPDVQPVQMANGLGKPEQDDDWVITRVGDEPVTVKHETVTSCPVPSEASNDAAEPEIRDEDVPF